MERLKLYRLLGAEVFQNVVFKIEKLKYKLLDKIPNIERKIDALIDFKYRLLSYLHKDRIPEYNEKKKFSKMRYRKEIYMKKNINYHCNMEYPSEFIKQLEFNKDVHMKGITYNIGALIAIILGSFIFPISSSLLIILSIYQVLALFINFECVNLQNYNLERFNNERRQNSFQKKTERSYRSNYQKYGKASEKICELLKNSSNIPSIDDTISVMETEEERKALLALAQKQKKRLVLSRKED